MTIIAGVDGCPAGWLCVRRDMMSGALSAQVFTTVADLMRHTAGVAALTIDIPIGLPDAGPRDCDLAARSLLSSPRASSVFPAPVRAVLQARSWQEACDLSAAACGKRLSKQIFAILDRIRSVDAALRSEPQLLARVREIHPEISFYFWNNQRPIAPAKRTPEGQAARRRLVEEAFGPVVDRIRQELPRRAASDDDILDAFAALWTAGRRDHLA